ncbi:MAG: helix-turn-helix transcriptional regulator [Defluviitaleaceae bacterium]|nr:helix-turn-helix transcriptional regulator [Defluviitaleaceae bacterium]
MQAMEACVYFLIKEKGKALDSLRKAYEEASPNDILMPFIELGKDMRTLAMAALREPNCGIPSSWLEVIRRKSSSYSKYQSLLVSEHKGAVGMENRNDLSHREKEVAYDLYQGFSRSEISERRNLKVSTVNNIINSVYKKLNAQNIADVVRILSEQKHT